MVASAPLGHLGNVHVVELGMDFGVESAPNIAYRIPPIDFNWRFVYLSRCGIQFYARKKAALLDTDSYETLIG